MIVFCSPIISGYIHDKIPCRYLHSVRQGWARGLKKIGERATESRKRPKLLSYTLSTWNLHSFDSWRYGLKSPGANILLEAAKR